VGHEHGVRIPRSELLGLDVNGIHEITLDG
jgi:hypothetical protein